MHTVRRILKKALGVCFLFTAMSHSSAFLWAPCSLVGVGRVSHKAVLAYGFMNRRIMDIQ